MTKLILFMGLVFLTACSVGFDGAQKAQLVAQISNTTSANIKNEGFSSCVATKDPSVYEIITNQEKMKNLDQLPLSDLEKIDSVVSSCKV
jgi:hypothetical protein